MKFKNRRNRISGHRISGPCIFPGYKWCGPNCSGPGIPFNDVDACCKAHDLCLDGDSQCNCDQAFLNCLRQKIDFNTEKGRIAAIMYSYMKLQTLFTCAFKK